MTTPTTAPPERTAHLVVTAEAMREADRRTCDDLGVPSFTLMESASRAVATTIRACYGPVEEKRIVAVCGPGGNGGDGLAVARTLAQYGAHVTALLIREDDLAEDTAKNLRLFRAEAEAAPERHRIVQADAADRARYDLAHADLYLDALLGTGLSAPPHPPYADLIRWLRECAAPVVSIDLPSGLDADTGQVLGDVAVRADRTITLAALKPGLLLGEGTEHAGAVEVAEIGIPVRVLEGVAVPFGPIYRTSDALVRRIRPRRARDAHKYSAGLVVALAGSPGITGAPILTCEAAARAGAGYVVCACPEAIEPLMAARFTEVATFALPQRGDALNPDAIVSALQPKLDKAKALVVGPGLGTATDTQRAVRALLAATALPFVLDADGLNAFADDTAALAACTQGRAVLTPHTGEFARLAGAIDLTDRITVAREHAAQWNAVLVLKGMPSLIATPAGTVYIVSTGGPALATAGTGDVLAGLCAGFLAQGATPEVAAVCAAHIGGAAADTFAARHDPSSLIATDLIRALPDVLAALAPRPDALLAH